jgi:hypothetical protein
VSLAQTLSLVKLSPGICFSLPVQADAAERLLWVKILCLARDHRVPEFRAAARRLHSAGFSTMISATSLPTAFKPCFDHSCYNMHPTALLGLVSESEDLNPTAQTAHSS